MRGGTIGTPSSPHSVDSGRGGTGGITTRGLGGGAGTLPWDDKDQSRCLAEPDSTPSPSEIAPHLLGMCILLGEELGDLDSNISMSEDTLCFPGEPSPSVVFDLLYVCLSNTNSELLERFLISSGL